MFQIVRSDTTSKTSRSTIKIEVLTEVRNIDRSSRESEASFTSRIVITEDITVDDRRRIKRTKMFRFVEIESQSDRDIVNVNRDRSDIDFGAGVDDIREERVCDFGRFVTVRVKSTEEECNFRVESLNEMLKRIVVARQEKKRERMKYIKEYKSKNIPLRV